MRKPLAEISGFRENMKGFRGKANDGEGVYSASVSRHEDEIVGGGAIGVEISLNDTILKHNILLLNMSVLDLDFHRWR